MKKILWFSRHCMTETQITALEAAVGPVEITQVDKTIQSAYELSDEIAAADIVAIVAPINLQAQFLKIADDNKPVITAISERKLVQKADGSESEAIFVFKEWQRIKKIEVVTEHFA